ncbi:MAG: hypothetical protein ACRD5J_20020 [Nitrososphaeraceae archaeon]
MIERNVRNELQKPIWGEDKNEGKAAVPTATSFFVLAVLSLGMFSSGILTSDVHAGALPCDPSTATCIDPDCDPTITSCPPVDPPGATKQSAACGPNAASACSPPGNPLGGETDNKRLDDVANRESSDDGTSDDDDDELASAASDNDTAGMPMMDEPILLSVHGGTSRDDIVNREDDGNDDNDDDDDTADMPMMDEPILLSVHGGTAGLDDIANEASDNDDDDEDRSLGALYRDRDGFGLRSLGAQEGNPSSSNPDLLNSLESRESNPLIKSSDDSGDPSASYEMDDLTEEEEEKEEENDDDDEE